MLKQCRAVLERELFYMWRDKSLRYILLVGPLLGMLLFAGVYSYQRIGNIPTGIVDLDNSQASRQVVSELKNTQNLQVAAYYDSYAQLEESIKRGEVIVGVVIPENFGKNIALHRQTKVAVFIDGMNMAYATNASSAVLTVTRTYGAQVGIQTLIAQGIQANQAQEAYQSIAFPEEAWFNSTLNYAYFTVLGFALNVWQQCLTLAACMTIIGENGLSSWLQIKASGISSPVLFFCKSVVHIAVFMLIVLPLYFLAFVVFKLPLACGWLNLLSFTLIFAIALHSLGTMMSSISRNAVNATRYGMIIALPAFVISGFTWPLEAMPQWFQHAAWFLPQTWFFQGINYLTFKNPGWGFMSHYYLVLGLMAVLFYSAAALRLMAEDFLPKGEMM
ncbi:ABC-type multidrug transport system, permease component [Desulfosporosinus acidiphilus SJ4]|uniref:ABC-type multidrug transport system, permease component n=1 Tax=Desulfosporosinus acidiphilus (strain DSM 22704 / JCM 16185 / SJ4) TaxID=646529 RepID=I4D9K2_DESAJ|nr:ABC transporter permease [Desulfosporosinus acidiphilus]AFM42476.1 ABC-type multidrug transport system, permease component [Desulfosporosinus acidiphilus SJ4]